MALEETAIYLVLIVIACLFTAFAVWRKTLIPNGLSFIVWLLLSPLHLGIAAAGTVTQIAPAVLYFGLSIIFLLLTVKSLYETVVRAIQEKNQQRSEVDVV